VNTTNIRARNFLHPFSILLILVLAGCAHDDGYQPVSGTIRFKGEPVKLGSIQFYRTGAETGVCGGTGIKDGKYEVPKEHGLKPGTYLVRISATEKVEGKARDEMNPFLSRETLPAKYNTQSNLTVEVRAGERGQFDFDLD
jgi:hypothetical protein